MYIPGPVVGASRPRVTKRGVYYPASHVKWELEALRHIRKANVGNAAFGEPVQLRITIMTTKLWRRPDVDNVAKLAMDAMTKAGVYFDDAQVCRLMIDRVVALPLGMWLRVGPIDDSSFNLPLPNPPEVSNG